jgi:hypothetical protein
MKASSARLTLNAARYFWRQAAIAGVEDREAFAYNINAAVVFGRSVTWHMQKQYAHQSGFEAWYGDEQATLKQDTACKFFNDARTTITHLKLKSARKEASVSIPHNALVIGWLVVQPKRAQPWYQRPPRILWEDSLRGLRRPIDRLQLRVMLRVEAWKSRRAAGIPVVSEVLYFDDPGSDKVPALDLVRRYLDVLEGVVARVEARFSVTPEA